MSFEFNDASILGCISNIAKYEKFGWEYRIILVTPNILDELGSIETGARQLKLYRGNDAIISRLKTAEAGDEMERKASTEISVIASEESPELIDIMRSMQNLRGQELDLTENSFRMREILGYFED